ncbi:MAG: hypothetical protein K0M69_00375 [Youngiibacter sp.]|nr:hypothetical protein [Youngiibacter sp.]
MALKKDFIDEVGTKTSYFRIAHIEENYLNPESFLTVYVKGYADKSYRDREKEVADKDRTFENYRERFRLSPDDNKGYGRGNLYKRLKTEVELFNDAVDI